MKTPLLEKSKNKKKCFLKPSVFGKNNAKGTLFSFIEIFQQIIYGQK